MNDLTLYKIAENFSGLMNLSDEIDAETLADTLAGIEMEFEDKSVNIVRVIQNMSTAAVDAEIARLTAIKKRIVNRKQWLKDYLRDQMQVCEITEIESDLFTITLRKPSKMVEITSEDDLPVSYQTMVPASWKINKKQILDDLKAGIEIPGAKMIDSKQGLTIK